MTDRNQKIKNWFYSLFLIADCFLLDFFVAESKFFGMFNNWQPVEFNHSVNLGPSFINYFYSCNNGWFGGGFCSFSWVEFTIFLALSLIILYINYFVVRIIYKMFRKSYEPKIPIIALTGFIVFGAILIYLAKLN